jgi:hypothetical protein
MEYSFKIISLFTDQPLAEHFVKYIGHSLHRGKNLKLKHIKTRINLITIMFTVVTNIIIFINVLTDTVTVQVSRSRDIHCVSA